MNQYTCAFYDSYTDGRGSTSNVTIPKRIIDSNRKKNNICPPVRTYNSTSQNSHHSLIKIKSKTHQTLKRYEYITF